MAPSDLLSVIDDSQALMPSAPRRNDLEMFQKGHAKPLFATTTRTSRSMSEESEMSDTEFEEDYSDVEEYSGRRSEESVSCYRSQSRIIC